MSKAEVLNTAPPEYYFNLENNSLLLLGSVAIKETLAKPAKEYVELLEKLGKLSITDTLDLNDPQLVSLAELLKEDLEGDPLNGTVPMEHITDHQTYLNYGGWLKSMFPGEADNNVFAPAIFDRAQQLGLGFSWSQIRVKFQREGGFKTYYEKTGLREPRQAIFNKWRIRDFVFYLKDVAEEIDERPTWRYLKYERLADKFEPSVDIMYQRLGGLSNVLELAGYNSFVDWSPQDYVTFGVKFMMTNNGRLPGLKDLLYLSKKGLAPTDNPIWDHFGNFKTYHAQVVEAYEEKKEQDSNHLSDIKKGKTDVPQSLYHDAGDDSKVLAGIQRYLLLKDSTLDVVDKVDERVLVALARKYEGLEFIILALELCEAIHGHAQTPLITSYLLTQHRRLYLDAREQLKLPPEIDKPKSKKVSYYSL